MTYNLDKNFIKRNKIYIIVIGLSLISIGLVFFYFMVVDKDWKILLGIAFMYLGFNKLKELKYWERNNKKIFLEISQENITISDSSEARSIQIKSIEK